MSKRIPDLSTSFWLLIVLCLPYILSCELVTTISPPLQNTAPVEPSSTETAVIKPVLSNQYRIGFRSTRIYPDWNTFTIKEDGTGLIRVSPKGGYDPVWSPDGRKIIFKSWEGPAGRGYVFYIADSDGSNVREVVTNLHNPGEIFWSPLGDEIAFIDDLDGGDQYKLYTVNVNSSVLSLLNSEFVANFWPDGWSPDGRYFLIESERDGDGEIFTINASTHVATQLTQNDWNNWSATWAPDGQRIAFVADKDGQNEVYVMGADGSKESRLSNNTLKEASVIWSPNGKYLLVRADQDQDYKVDLYRMDVETGKSEMLVEKTVGGSAWSPDSERIAFNCDTNGDGKWGICLVSADGGPVAVVTEFNESWPIWSPVPLP